MLTINLLPQGARKPVHSPLQQFHRTPLFWLGIIGMAFTMLSPVLLIQMYRGQVRQLASKINALQPKKAEVDRLQQWLQTLQGQQAAFQHMRHGEGSWSRRLNILSDLTPDGVWFTEFDLDEERGLVIQGAAMSQGGAEMVAVGRLVSDLKAEPVFSSAVRDIQIESIKRVQEEGLELVEFTLTCALAEPPSS